MDMFNPKDRRHPKMDNYMDISKPGFGGPDSKIDKDKSKRTFLKGYQREIERNPDFEGGVENPNYDSTWVAITRDVVHRQAGKKPFNKMENSKSKMNEGRILRYEEFLNEDFSQFLNDEENEMPNGMEGMEEMPNEPKLDEEKLEALIEEFGDQMKEMIEAVCEKMEMDKSECCDYICEAVKMTCHSNEEEENEEGEKEEENEDK